MKIRSFLLAMMLCALCVTQASALEYDFDAPEDYLFGQPTSDDTIYEWESPNVDRSKNTALVAPGAGGKHCGQGQEKGPFADLLPPAPGFFPGSQRQGGRYRIRRGEGDAAAGRAFCPGH